MSMSEKEEILVEGGERIHGLTFLEKLYHASVGYRTIPRVNRVFLDQFQALSEQDQVKAMGHICTILDRHLPLPANKMSIFSFEEILDLVRLEELYKTWFAAQTEYWVDEYYSESLVDARWQRHMARKREKEEDTLARRISNGEAPLPGEESAYEDAVIAALSEKAKEVLGL